MQQSWSICDRSHFLGRKPFSKSFLTRCRIRIWKDWNCKNSKKNYLFSKRKKKKEPAPAEKKGGSKNRSARKWELLLDPRSKLHLIFNFHFFLSCRLFMLNFCRQKNPRRYDTCWQNNSFQLLRYSYLTPSLTTQVASKLRAKSAAHRKHRKCSTLWPPSPFFS